MELDTLLKLMNEIYGLLATFVVEIQNFLLYSFTIGDYEYTILECLFGVGLSIILAFKIVKSLAT